MTLAIDLKAAARRLPVRLDVAGWAILGLVALSTTVKFSFQFNAPLWLDEVWTGMIASQRTLAGLARQCILDVNAPLDYVVEWAWSFVGGLSDEALRFPSRLFASLAPLIALAPSKTIDRTTRLVWCGLLACWLPGLFFAIEARCYPLVLMLATASTVTFAELLSRPTLGRAWAWTTLSSLLILAHYVSGALVACEGVAYLAVCRAKALRTWPAALAFVPAAVSVAVQLSLLVAFTTPSVVRVAPVRLSQTGDAVEFFVGGQAGIWVILCWAAASLLFGLVLRRVAVAGEASRRGSVQAPAPAARESAPVDDDARLWIVPAASVAAVALCFAVSFWRPIIVYRYLTAMTPGILLGVAMLARHLQRCWRLAPAALVAMYGGIVAGELLGSPRHLDLFNYQWETASDALMAVDTRRLVFMWDNPSTWRGDPDAFGQVGGFFFKRAGRPIPVDWTPAVPGENPNIRLLARSASPGTAILWLYDPAIAGTTAKRFPADIDRIDPSWGCRDFGDHGQHVVTCTRAWGPSPATAAPASRVPAPPGRPSAAGRPAP